MKIFNLRIWTLNFLIISRKRISSSRGGVYQYSRGLWYLHITLKLAEVIVGPFTYDGTVEVFWLELQLLQNRGPVRQLHQKDLVFIGMWGELIAAMSIANEANVLYHTVMLAAC